MVRSCHSFTIFIDHTATAAIAKGYYTLSPICDTNAHCNKVLSVAKEVKLGNNIVGFLPPDPIDGSAMIFKIQPLHDNEIMIFVPKSCSTSGRKSILSGQNKFRLLVDTPLSSKNAFTMYYNQLTKDTFTLAYKDVDLGEYIYIGPEAFNHVNSLFSYGTVAFSSEKVNWKLTRVFINETGTKFYNTIHLSRVYRIWVQCLLHSQLFPANHAQRNGLRDDPRKPS